MAKHCMEMSVLALGVFTLYGCANDAIDIGDQETAAAKSGLAAYAGTWDGYIEASTWEDGTDRVRLTIDENGAGTLQLGERALIANATEPAANYPPQLLSSPGPGPVLPLFSGFEYPLYDAQIASARLKFSIAAGDLFGSYCALQTPYLNEAAGEYRCVPFTGYTVIDGKCYIPDGGVSVNKANSTTMTEYACEQVDMCNGNGGCTCTATGCTGSSLKSLNLDAALDDGQQNLVGTLIDGAGTQTTVRLKRQ